jgi:hypothetical protein
MDNIDQTIDQISNRVSEALDLICEIDKVQRETDGDLMDTYADIPEMLRTYYAWRKAFDIHKIPFPRTVKEMEDILLKAKPEEPKIRAVPPFGKGQPRLGEPNLSSYLFLFEERLLCVWARTQEEAVSAVAKTWRSDRDLLRKYRAFAVAKNGGLESYYQFPRD